MMADTLMNFSIVCGLIAIFAAIMHLASCVDRLRLAVIKASDKSVEIKLPEDTSQMTYSLEQIAWAAGRSFQHGMRTDR